MKRGNLFLCLLLISILVISGCAQMSPGREIKDTIKYERSYCGDGICTSENDEDCITCSEDCNHEELIILGDLDGDGGHGSGDIVKLANCIILGLSLGIDPIESCAGDCTAYPNIGDINVDGEINIKDHNMLANCVLSDQGPRRGCKVCCEESCMTTWGDGMELCSDCQCFDGGDIEEISH